MAQRIELPNRFPLYSPLSTRSDDVPLTKDSRLINGYVEYDPADKQYWIYKRPGLAVRTSGVFPDPGPSTGRGIYQSPAIADTFSAMTVFGQQLYVGNSPVGGLLDNAGGQFTFDSVVVGIGVAGSTIPTAVVLNNTVRQYLLTRITFGYALTDITASIPTQNLSGSAFNIVPGWCFLDSTLYAMDVAGNIFGSNLNDPTTWNALNVVKADSNADKGVAIAKQLSYLIALKQDSTQVFFDNQNAAPGTPLSPVPDSQIPLGCLAGYSVQSIDNSLLWLTSNESVAPQIVQMDNLVPKIISTPSVERLLKSFQTGQVPFNMQNDTSSWVLKLSGHRWYGLTSLSLNITLVYDLDQQAWYIWTDSQGNSFPIIGASYTGAVGGGIGGQRIVQHVTDGNVYFIDDAKNIPNDLGVLVPVDIYTPNFDGGIDKSKTLTMLRFNADQTPGSRLNARYNDNDYASDKWSNFRNIDLSQERPFIDNEGSFYRRAYHLRHLCNTALRIKSGDLLLGIGTL